MRRERVKIEKIRVRGVNIPLIKSYDVAVVGTLKTTESVIVEVFTKEGIVGVGEADPSLMFTGESQKTVMTALQHHLGPAILGMDPLDIEMIHARMDSVCLGNNFAKAAIDLACHDILGKFYNAPVYALLGGLLRERIPIMWSLGSDSVESNVEDAVQKVEEGYRTIGLKLGSLPPHQDVERVRAVRKAVGDNIHIRCDANQAWTTNVAVSTIRRLEELNVAMVEQPVPAWNVEGMACVRAAVNVPIAVDEGLCSPRDALQLIRAKAADIFSIKTTKLGGLLPSKKVAAIVGAAGSELFINSMIEMGVSVMAGLHFALTSNNLSPIGHALASVRRLQDDILKNPIPYEGAEIVTPKCASGLGVELDEGKMPRYGVDEIWIS